MKVRRRSLGCARSIRLKRPDLTQYMDLIDLGDELCEVDKRKVVRKTTTITRIGSTVVTEIVHDNIEFS